MLAVVRRRIGIAALGVLLGAALISIGYRFGPRESGGWGAIAAGTSIVLGWSLLLLVVFMIVLPTLLPHR